MVVSMETRKRICDKNSLKLMNLAPKFQCFLKTILGQLFRVKKCKQLSSLTMH